MDANDQAAVLREHLHRLRQIPCLKNSTFIGAVEGNYGAPTAVVLSRVFREFRPYSICVDNSRGGSGSSSSKRKRTTRTLNGQGQAATDARLYVWTHEEDKDRQVVITRNLLRKPGGLGFLRNLAICSRSLPHVLGQPEPCAGPQRTAPMVKELCDQLSRYRRVTKMARFGQEAWQKDKSKWTGKGGGFNDDLAMAFFIAVSRATTIANSTQFVLEGMLTS